MAYTLLTENMKDSERERFDADIGMIENPDNVARDELKAYQKANGITFDDPDAPVSADPTSDAGIDIEY